MFRNIILIDLVMKSRVDVYCVLTAKSSVIILIYGYIVSYSWMKADTALDKFHNFKQHKERFMQTKAMHSLHA